MKKLWKFYVNTSFMAKMTTGFVLGIVVGILLGPKSSVLYPLGKLFLNLLQMIVIPLVILPLIVAVNTSNPKELGRIGAKIFPFYFISTAVAVILGIILAKWTNPGVGLTLPNSANITAPESPSFINTLLNMVPTNIFSALSSGDLLAIVFITIVGGLAILFLRHSPDENQRKSGDLLFNVLQACNEVVTKILAGVLLYAPIGVFGITANTFGSQGIDLVIVLGKFIGTSYLGVILLITVIFPIFLKLFGVKVIQFYKDIKEAMLTAFVTSSSIGTLPISLKCAEKSGISNKVSRLTLPLGLAFNLNGTALRFGVAVIFASEIIGISLSVPELATIVIISTLAAVGTAGVPGAGLIGMSIVFSQANLPIEIVALTAGINVLLDMIFTCGNVVGDLVGAKIVDQSERHAGAIDEPTETVEPAEMTASTSSKLST
ncbi:dicarboxylate/amino acid:cation symporter [Acinetobacter pullicarnis]|uniref:dicarboxylate/amino acid:cation symporter n=1 Tax=Acinetobacter pullicarnis TaxID=2576829 RepID=UPI001C073997|nr:dicarboxylate/amino acid:cation symporter [Acinetobacter pullicarnis]